jgi:ribosome-interacting GTPase 1
LGDPVEVTVRGYELASARRRRRGIDRGHIERRRRHEYKNALPATPNSGKTTMFNDLTGSSSTSAIGPASTVERKRGRFKGHKDVVIQDLPAFFALSLIRSRRSLRAIIW